MTAVAGVLHVTPANVEIGDVFEIIITNHRGQSVTLTFAATAATVKNVVDALQAAGAAYTAAGLDVWKDLVFTDDDTKLIITGPAGKPFGVVCSTTDGGGNNTQTLVATEATAVEGPGLLYLSDNYLNNTGLRLWTCDITPANVEIDDVFSVTLTDPITGTAETISFTATAATVVNVVEGLAALADAAGAPWTLVTASEDDAKLTLTRDAEGPALQVACTATNGGAANMQTLVVSYADTGDDLIISRLGDAALHGGDYTAWPLAEFREEAGYEPDVAAGDYACGAPLRPLHIDADDFEYAGMGEQFIELDNSTLATVMDAMSSNVVGQYGLHLTGTNNAKLMTRTGGGAIGVAMSAGDTAEFTEIDAGGGTVHVGEGATCTTLNVSAGDVTSWCNLTTVNWYGGSYAREGGTLTTYNGFSNGQATSNSEGTITTVALAGGSVLDLTRTRPVTLTNVSANGEAAGLWYPFGNVTLPNGIDAPNCGFDKLSMRTPPGHNWPMEAIT